MNAQPERNTGENGAVYDRSNGIHRMDAEQKESWDAMDDGNLQLLIEWLNHVLPELNLPLDTSEEELRACLIDGTILCNILNKLRPGLVEMRGNVAPGPQNVKKFLAAMDEMGLRRFVLTDIQQGYMVPVLQCLWTLKAHFDNNGGHGEHDQHAFAVSEVVPLKQGLYADLSDANILELMKTNGFDNASTRTLFNLLNKILDESTERKNEQGHHMAHLLKKVVQVIERRVSTQAFNIKDQNNVYKVHTEKYQSRIRVLETLAAGTTEEIEVLLSQLQQIKIEKQKIEEKEKLEEKDLHRIKEEKKHSDIEKSQLKLELELAKKTHEERCLLLEAQSKETKIELEKKLKELERFLVESRKKVNELESFSESKSQRWRKKEGTYQSFLDCQFKALQELRVASESIKHEVLTTKRNYSEEFYYLGMKLKTLADAAENYHSVLEENRRLYNEVQDLKGNIRVYCRIRPFLSGQCKKQTTIEYIGENGELVVSNPLKQGKDTHRLFKFNKVFGPTASQEEVFLDTQPLIRSVLDGYNVCIFAYGQTGSGKTYTMSGPNGSSEEDWGVNYRALHDLFQISQSRKGSIRYEVGVQMVEIYNEQVRDLLSYDGSQKRFGIWNTAQPNGLAVPDASMYGVASTSDVLELMSVGLMNRAVGATALNERSSRSHSILTVHVHGTDSKTGAVFRGSLHLVDLAGSERVDRSEATGERLREAQHINKSLSALGDVIFALSQKSPHVPYRNSKLTQVLQSSLGGQAKTLMFVQLNPDVDSYSETISTLKFAERVSGVELGAAKSNKEGRDIRELMEQITSLKEKVAKKDEEIEWLQQFKDHNTIVKHGTSPRHKSSSPSPRHKSSSPSRHSIGPARRSPRPSVGKGFRSFDKVYSDVDNTSEYSEKHSEAGSMRSVDNFRHHKEMKSKSTGDLRLYQEFLPQPKFSDTEAGHGSRDDIDLLSFGDGDADERLSDISDGGLSMGTETDASIGSAAEFALFREFAETVEAEKPSEATTLAEAETLAAVATSSNSVKPAEKADSAQKPSFASKLPKPPQKQMQTRLSRLSLAASSTPKVSSMSAPRKNTAVSSSATKPQRRWH